MKEVINAVYYHIGKGNNMCLGMWEEGATISFNPHKENHFTRSIQREFVRLYEACKRNQQFYQDFFSGPLVAPDKISTNDVMDKDGQSFKEVERNFFDNGNNLRAFNQKYSQLLRETILERERQTNYPHLPSRKSCLWMCTLDTIKDWDETLGPGDRNYFEINVSGKVFHTDGELIDSDDYQRPIFFNVMAEKYWAANHELGREEILFEGDVTIIKKYDSIQHLLDANKS